MSEAEQGRINQRRVLYSGDSTSSFWPRWSRPGSSVGKCQTPARSSLPRSGCFFLFMITVSVSLILYCSDISLNSVCFNLSVLTSEKTSSDPEESLFECQRQTFLVWSQTLTSDLPVGPWTMRVFPQLCFCFHDWSTWRDLTCTSLHHDAETKTSEEKLNLDT